jgi:hypothetical protein
VTQTHPDYLTGSAMARKHDDALKAYQRAQVTAYCVLVTGGSPRLVSAALARLDAARWEMVAAEAGR